MLHRVFELERIIDGIVDRAFPPGANPHHWTRRGYVPRPSLALGCMVKEWAVPGGTRELLDSYNASTPSTLPSGTGRDYFRVDATDFIEYATSELARWPSPQDFTDRRISFVEGLGVDGAPSFEFEYDGAHREATLLDFAVARQGPALSVSSRFGISPLGTVYQPGRHPWNMTTLIFIDRNDFLKKRQPANGSPELMEVNRAHAQYDPDTLQWTFASAGQQTLFLMRWVGEQMVSTDKRSRDFIGPVPLDDAKAIVEHFDRNYNAYPVLIELTRIGLHLPAYLRFMYDLVKNERVAAGTKVSKRVVKVGGRRKHKHVEEVVYRTIKSIRVIHSEAEQRPARRWTAPKFAFLVRGHWRTYRDPSTRGHDPDGNVVFGRTWVSEHQKGEEHGDLGPLETVVAVRDPGVVISIKQPLSYARDVVEAHSRDEATAPKSAPASDSTHLANRESAVEPSNPPSEEWRVAERAKLTAALRFMILRRDRFSCQICGRNKANENFIKLEVDHKTPIIQWGRTVETNLWTLCDRCNRGKSSLSLQ